ncbi:hypothetical protein P4S52_15635 [Vibrio sp. SA48]
MDKQLKELEYIKLKVDWYKSIYPWYLAMLAGEVAFLQKITPEGVSGNFAYYSVVLSICFLSVALLATWQSSLPLIHRLEEPYEPQEDWKKFLLWTPQGRRWEAILASISGACFGGAIATFIAALIVNGFGS